MTEELKLLLHRYKPVPDEGLGVSFSFSSQAPSDCNTHPGSRDIQITRGLILIRQLRWEESQRREWIRQISGTVDGHFGTANG
jgi:hypothetical protein